MPILRITIQLGNDGMQTRQEIAEVLHKVANQFLDNGNVHSIKDENGNAVGKLEITRD